MMADGILSIFSLSLSSHVSLFFSRQHHFNGIRLKILTRQWLIPPPSDSRKFSLSHYQSAYDCPLLFPLWEQVLFWGPRFLVSAKHCFWAQFNTFSCSLPQDKKSFILFYLSFIPFNRLSRDISDEGWTCLSWNPDSSSWQKRKLPERIKQSVEKTKLLVRLLEAGEERSWESRHLMYSGTRRGP